MPCCTECCQSKNVDIRISFSKRLHQRLSLPVHLKCLVGGEIPSRGREVLREARDILSGEKEILSSGREISRRGRDIKWREREIPRGGRDTNYLI